MRVKVTSHVARASYGIVCVEPFIDGHHLEEDRKRYEAFDDDCACNQMHWYLRKVRRISQCSPPHRVMEAVDWQSGC